MNCLLQPGCGNGESEMGRIAGVKCDGCPVTVEVEGNWSQFWKGMKAKGWQKGMNGKVFCPECVRAGKAEAAPSQKRTRFAMIVIAATLGGLLGASAAHGAPVVVAPVVAPITHSSAHGSGASLEGAPADAFFTVHCRNEGDAYTNKEGLTIGACRRTSFWNSDQLCETFEEMARKRGCVLTGISFNDYSDMAVVYCRRGKERE